MKGSIIGGIKVDAGSFRPVTIILIFTIYQYCANLF